MSSVWADVRYAVRLWMRNPGFAGTAVLTLTLGIGANTTMFSVVNATLFTPLAFPDPDRLQSVWQGRVEDPSSLNIVSLPNYRDWVAQNHSFQDLALFDSAGRGYNLTGSGEPEQVSGVRVTASFFRVLGVEPMLGRTFRPEEETPGRDRVVVLSHGLWTRRYAADPSIVGKTIQIDSAAYTVVGVMPASFRFQFWSDARQLWVPAGWTRGDLERGSNSFVCLGRLRDGVTLTAARAEMDTIGRRLARAYPSNAGLTVRVVPVQEYGAQSLRAAMFALLGAVTFVLLIACVNVANLMLARTAARQGELAIRSAIGAGRARLVRQLVTESVLLSLVGGLCGLVLAGWTTSALAALLPALQSVPLRPLERIDLDLRVLGFTTTVSIACGVLSALAPALTVGRRGLAEPLKGVGRSTGGGGHRVRYGLVAAEVALTLVVLAGAGMLIASVARLLGVDPGLNPSRVLVMEMSLPQEDLYYGPPTHAMFCRDLAQRVGSVPGVQSVSAIAHLPLSGAGAGRSVGVEGRPDPGPERRPGAGYSVVCPGLPRTLGIPLLLGRDFTDRDVVGAPGVLIVNETMARRLWPGEEAVGKRLKLGAADSNAEWLTVVGVIRDFRHGGLADDVEPLFFRPYTQAAWPSMSIVTKTASAPAGFIAPLKKALAEIEPAQPVSSIRTMDEVLSGSVASRRYPMVLLSVFALLALVLAAVGIAGVVAYTVVQRSQEIGVRMALGAQSQHVLRLVVGQSMLWMLGGLAGGLLGSFGLLRMLGSLLYDVRPTDPFVLVSVSVIVAGVALGASVIPARRATRVDPLQALRAE
jgi:putative ABC transport system permease protein